VLRDYEDGLAIAPSEYAAKDERAESDSLPETADRLLPLHPLVRRVGPHVGDVAMLGERLASTRQVAALLQACVGLQSSKSRRSTN